MRLRQRYCDCEAVRDLWRELRDASRSLRGSIRAKMSLWRGFLSTRDRDS